MKILLTSLYLTFTTTIINAQSIQKVPLENFHVGENAHLSYVYYKDVNNLLDKYLGTWEYNQNGHFFKITFFKQTNFRETPVGHPKASIFTDRIYGLYQYKLNGIEIYHVISPDFAYSSSGAFIMGSFTFYFKEPSLSPCGRPLMGKVTLAYSTTNSIEQLTWSRVDSYRGTFCNEGEVEDNTPFQTPAHMELIKVP
jgi:hypothetical protein